MSETVKTPKAKNELVIFDVKKFSIAQLPELRGKKEEIASIIAENPIVEIIDNETYEQAKKSRTGVRSLRTATEKEQSEVKRNVKTLILDAIDSEYTTIVSGIKSEENKRQDIVTAWEAKKEAEKNEKARLEQERKDNINNLMADYVTEWKTAFNLMVFDTVEQVGASFLESYTNYDLTVLEEFESLFPAKIKELTEYYTEKTTTLTDAEKARSTKVIGEWFVAWGGKLFSMVFENASETVKLFEEQQKLNFPIQEFQDDFNKKYEELKSQVLAKQKSLIEAKNAADNAAKQKEKEEQEKEEIFEIRKNRLLELGMFYSDEHDTFYVDASEDLILLCDDIKEESTLEFEKTIAEAKQTIQEFKNKSLVPVVFETPSSTVIKGIESEEACLEVFEELKPTTETVETTQVLAPELPTVNVCTNLESERETKTEAPKNLVEYPLTPAESFNAPTWEDIIEEFKTSGEKSYSKFLIDNYNVPTKIQ